MAPDGAHATEAEVSWALAIAIGTAVGTIALLSLTPRLRARGVAHWYLSRRSAIALLLLSLGVIAGQVMAPSPNRDGLVWAFVTFAVLFLLLEARDVLRARRDRATGREP